MATTRQPRRNRDLRPVLLALEERALLNGSMPTHLHHIKAALADVKHPHIHTSANAPAPTITIISRVDSNGYRFINFDGPNADTTGTFLLHGTMMNGISNRGLGVGFTSDNNGAFTNFTADHARPTIGRILSNPALPKAVASGINNAGIVVGTDGNGNASFLVHGSIHNFIPLGGASAAAFGINDHNTIVGQVVEADTSPGFIRVNANTYITINAPSGPNIVSAQGINNKGLVVGSYYGTDGQIHGFTANAKSAVNGVLTGTPVADPVIPAVPGEPGATFVSSQILGVNDHGIAVGYYSDSTDSQHGFLYNTNTGQYTFLDNPRAAFNNDGVGTITRITGITNAGEITGSYSDANQAFHGFQARTL